MRTVPLKQKTTPYKNSNYKGSCMFAILKKEKNRFVQARAAHFCRETVCMDFIREGFLITPPRRLYIGIFLDPKAKAENRKVIECAKKSLNNLEASLGAKKPSTIFKTSNRNVFVLSLGPWCSKSPALLSLALLTTRVSILYSNCKKVKILTTERLFSNATIAPKKNTSTYGGYFYDYLGTDYFTYESISGLSLSKIKNAIRNNHSDYIKWLKNIMDYSDDPTREASLPPDAIGINFICTKGFQKDYEECLKDMFFNKVDSYNSKVSFKDEINKLHEIINR